MKFVERKDLNKAKCNVCNLPAKYITRVPFPIGVNKYYDYGMRIRLCLCNHCLDNLYKMGIEFY